MSIETIVIIVLLAAFIIWRLRPVKGIRNITTAQLKNELKDRNKQFIDVRTPGEFRGNSIRGFKNIPLNQLSAKAASLSMDKEVVLICQSGMRSSQASRILKKMGFQKITNVKGGMNAWI
ncbi:rhodanese-like domain-containing protein [Bacillus tuaregi]|uniref:rhodanese-like domain-containing protein n=1 Tax=Bacillus tuaregi TaxID=1816695 RepID=UPI0008F9618B|nr:rhodanese-like domain-containing protein [Bacillus tuaregi]